MANEKVVILDKKEEFLESVTNFLERLPADTRSVQCLLYAFDSGYDDYNEKTTKEVSAQDGWLILPDQMRIDLLSSAVTSFLNSAKEYLRKKNGITEDDKVKAEELAISLKGETKTLARSFSLYADSIDTAKTAERQLEILFEGIVDLDDPKLFFSVSRAFSKKEGLKPLVDEMKWRLMKRARKNNQFHNSSQQPEPQQNEPPKVGTVILPGDGN